VINLWHQTFVTADTTAAFVNNQHGIQQRGQDFDKKFVFEALKGYTAKRLTDEFLTDSPACLRLVFLIQDFNH